MKNFTDNLKDWLKIIMKVVKSNDIDHDDQPYVEKAVANRLMFLAAVNFNRYLANRVKNRNSLNEAIDLRDASIKMYDNFPSTAMADDVENILRNFAPAGNVTVTYEEGHEPEVPAFVKARQDDAKKRAEAEEKTLAERYPDIKGFLTGAKYDRFDLMPSEFDADRARRVAESLAKGIVTQCESQLNLRAGKWQKARDEGDEASMKFWEDAGIKGQSALDSVVNELDQHDLLGSDVPS